MSEEIFQIYRDPTITEYCTCIPLGLREVIDCRGLTCHYCGLKITDETYRFAESRRKGAKS